MIAVEHTLLLFSLACAPLSLEAFVASDPAFHMSGSVLIRQAPQTHRAASWLAATVPKEDETGVASKESLDEPDMKAFACGFKTVFEELPYRACAPSVGSLPSDLQGSYFRVGPAMFSAGSIVPPKAYVPVNFF